MKYSLHGQESERLRFRQLSPDDFNNWIDIFRDKSACDLLGMSDLTNPEERCERWFSLSENREKNGLGCMNVLIDKTTNEFIGQCGLLVQEIDGETELEIGYSILPKHWNKGYATECARKCRDFAFFNSYSDTLISIVHIENIKSEKEAIKNGMTKVKQTIFKESPVNIYRINKKDWLNNGK
jgi:RimJ/RimL family protein N-acetyltransferase